MLLSEVATISSGYLFRARIENQEDGQYHVIQMKDIDSFNCLKTNGLSRVNLKSIRNESLVQRGDIIFRCRGQQNMATLVDQPMENTIAVSQFFIIRVKNKEVLPAYLSWYINQKPAQRDLKRKAAGSRTQHINKKNLEQFEVVVPDMGMQKKIVELHNLSIREEKLIITINDKRKQLLAAVSLKNLKSNA